MEEFLKIVFSNKTLTVTNIILAGCIIFHLICEFTHYVYSFFSDRKRISLLEDLNNRLKILEEKHKCCKEYKEE